ncbi:hypothetical protein PoB_006269600 [Plakobranchus ocellatus]|uniref:Uncharacterized protein n=1 Tax=Plakobranchus ocellatus TaxID=259542 RepID=A0AAV4CWB9_9GAST|nr:hypothetical protein PoB_006269600 [Plakobranchus ocellatus]
MRPASRQGRRPPGSGIEIDAGSEGSDENLTQGAFPILSKGQGQQKSNNVQDSGKINEEEEEQGNLQDMSRAERDVFMFSEFKKDAANRDKPVTSTTADARKGSQKNSKHCIVM